MSYKDAPTTDLLDLAEDYLSLANPPEDMPPHRYRESAMIKLAEIDTELLSRMPEGKFVTMLDKGNQPVGFEPYIPNEDEAWLFDALYGHIPTVDELGW